MSDEFFDKSLGCLAMALTLLVVVAHVFFVRLRLERKISDLSHELWLLKSYVSGMWQHCVGCDHAYRDWMLRGSQLCETCMKKSQKEEAHEEVAVDGATVGGDGAAVQ